MINGVTKAGIATELQKNEFKHWKWVLIIGVLNIALGIAIALNPILGVIGVGYIVQITLAAQGISAIVASLSN